MSPSRPTVRVVVVSYRTKELTLACLADLPDEPWLSVVVVDNDATDGTAAAIREQLPGVSVIDPGRNLGFARGVNAGAAALDTDYVLLLNPDGRLRPGAIEALIDFAEEHPDRGLYGGPVYRDEGRLALPAARRLPTLRSVLHFGVGLSLLPGLSDPDVIGLRTWDRTTERVVGMLTGALLLVRADVWIELGGFDERFFVYGDDADLGRRASAAGYRPTFVPSPGLDHAVGASSESGTGNVLLMAGKVTYQNKHWPPWQARIGGIALRSGVLLRAVAQRVLRRPGPDWAAVWQRRGEWVHGFGPDGEFPFGG